MKTNLDDDEIVERIIAGEQSLFSVLVRRYQNFVFTIALRFSPSREDAEEIAQDVFVKAYQGLSKFEGTSRFSTWLYTITCNSGKTFLRKGKLNTWPLECSHLNNLAEKGDPNTDLLDSKIMILRRSIELLNSEDASLIEMFYMKDLSLKEIGALTGTNATAVKSKLWRCRERLKEKVKSFM